MLGPFALEVGLARLRAQDAYREVILHIDRLAEETPLMVALTIWGPHSATVVHSARRITRIHANVRAGGGFARQLSSDLGYRKPRQTRPGHGR